MDLERHKISKFLNLDVVEDGCRMELDVYNSNADHKKHEISVYSFSKSLIESTSETDDCMVFIGDNLFVRLSKNRGLEVLERQIKRLEKQLAIIDDERKSLQKKIGALEFLRNTSNDQLENEPLKHSDSENNPINSSVSSDSRNRKQDINHRPTGVSKKDFSDFIDLIDDLNLNNEELEDESASSDSEITDAGCSNNKNVHFNAGNYVKAATDNDNDNTNSSGVKKSILRNKNEVSPVDVDAVNTMNQRDIKKTTPISEQVFRSFVVERNVGVVEQISLNMTNTTTGETKGRISMFKQKYI